MVNKTAGSRQALPAGLQRGPQQKFCRQGDLLRGGICGGGGHVGRLVLVLVLVAEAGRQEEDGMGYRDHLHKGLQTEGLAETSTTANRTVGLDLDRQTMQCNSVTGGQQDLIVRLEITQTVELSNFQTV